MAKFRALSQGFIHGARVRAGAEFEAPDGFKAKWAVPAGTLRLPKPSPQQTPQALSQMGQAKSKTFTEVMGRGKGEEDLT